MRPYDVDYSVLNGVLPSGETYKITLGWGRCANPRCDRIFRPRADGDTYCCDACDLDDNPNFESVTDNEMAKAQGRL